MLYNSARWSFSEIKNELSNLSPKVKSGVFTSSGTPLVFYAIQRKSPTVLSLILRSGADLRQIWDVKVAKDTSITMDPLTFAIVHDNYKPYEDANLIVKILLAFGANPHSIPAELLRYEPQADADLFKSKNIYPPYFVKHLRNRLNAVLKYFILKAQRAGKLTQREIALVKLHSLEEMRRADFLEIGQEYAARKIHDTFITRIFENPSEAGPLVFAFAGPSGHGKTNFAKAMGEFARCEVLTIDISHYTEKSSLFGSSLGFRGAETGSPLNNHLAKFSGKLSVVLLDEFDKTKQSIRECFLTMWDGGTHIDRRDNTTIDCSKTVFVLCTNAGLDEIENFWRDNKDDIAARKLSQDDYDYFGESKVRQALLQAWKAPVVSRLSAIVPFLFFTPEEQAVAAAECYFVHRRHLGPAHKAIINFENEQEWLVHQAVAGRYAEACGYRSLKQASSALILSPFSRRYIEVDKPLPEDDGDMEEYRFQTSPEDKCKITVRKVPATASDSELNHISASNKLEAEALPDDSKWVREFLGLE